MPTYECLVPPPFDDNGELRIARTVNFGSVTLAWPTISGGGGTVTTGPGTTDPNPPAQRFSVWIA